MSQPLPPPAPPSDLVALPGGARPLSPSEYDATLRDLLGDTMGAGRDRLPEPAASRDLPFENDAPSKTTSNVLIEALEELAWGAAGRAVKRPEALARILPCTPKGPDDRACLESFVTRFGRRALRRPLAREEVDGYLRLQSYAVEKRDFNEAVRLVIAALLQQPDFYNRVELGVAVPGKPGLFRLDDFEAATKLSYFILGTTPDDRLLDLAAARKLTQPADLATAARTLLADPRARERLFEFHAEWLGFARVTHDLMGSMRAETRAVLDEVVFTRGASYHDVFLADRSFVDEPLARHYGLPPPAKPGWVPVGGTTGRLGILSHGSFLSAAAKPDDTSPVNRGLLVASRLLCRHIPDPPPDVNASLPTEGRCRADRLKAHIVRGSSCNACHAQIDPIGFGLEAYDRTGRLRQFEKDEMGRDKTDCPIDGRGEVPGMAPFRGPAELARLLTSSGQLDRCATAHLVQFAAGRQPTGAEPLIERLDAQFRAQGRKFLDLVVALVTDASFVYRRGE